MQKWYFFRVMNWRGRIEDEVLRRSVIEDWRLLRSMLDFANSTDASLISRARNVQLGLREVAIRG